jgi:hypothetical protein
MNKFFLIAAFFCNSMMCMELVPYMDSITCLTDSNGSLERSMVICAIGSVGQTPNSSIFSCALVCAKWADFICKIPEIQASKVSIELFNVGLHDHLNQLSVGIDEDYVAKQFQDSRFRSYFEFNHLCYPNYFHLLINSGVTDGLLEKFLNCGSLKGTERQGDIVFFGWFCSPDKIKYVDLFSKAQFNFNATDILHEVGAALYPELVQELLQKGCQVDKKNGYGRTVLGEVLIRNRNKCASINKLVKTVVLLLEAGADQNIGSNYGDGLLSASEAAKYVPVAIVDSYKDGERKRILSAVLSRYQRTMVAYDPNRWAKERVICSTMIELLSVAVLKLAILELKFRRPPCAVPNKLPIFVDHSSSDNTPAKRRCSIQ